MFGKRSDETRTPEDRARAAADRAAKRAGRPLPQEAFEYAVPPPDMQDFERPEPPPPPEPEPPVQHHTVEYTPPFAEEPAGEPRVRRIPRDDPRVERQGEERVSSVPPTAEHEIGDEDRNGSPIAVTDRPLPPKRRPAPPANPPEQRAAG